MAKTGKNSNYQTEKRAAAAAEKERELRKKRRRKIATAILVPVVCVMLIVATILGVIGKKNGWFRDPVEITHYVTFIFDKYDGVVDKKGNPSNAEVTIALYGDEAPITVENFVKLCNEGYYNGTTFHRIIDGFVAQGGDGPDKPSIKGEFDANGYKNRIPHERGTISMARTNDMDSANTQFFIVLETSKNNTESLDGKYASFGKVVSGMKFFDIVSEGKNSDSLAENERPKILSVMVETPEEYAARMDIVSDSE